MRRREKEEEARRGKRKGGRGDRISAYNMKREFHDEREEKGEEMRTKERRAKQEGEGRRR